MTLLRFFGVYVVAVVVVAAFDMHRHQLVRHSID